MVSFPMTNKRIAATVRQSKKINRIQVKYTLRLFKDLDQFFSLDPPLTWMAVISDSHGNIE